jgi:1-acyl-sn-glycerol-3-phosphate acyltransferase
LRLHYRLGWCFLLASVRVLFGFRTRGSENVPTEGPVIVACNHISYWDPVLIGLGIRREVYFMAKEELFDNRFLAWLIRAYNAIPVPRGALGLGAFGAASKVLASGAALLIFPEGTRSLTGELGDARPGVGLIATRARAPVVPVHISGSANMGAAFARRRKLEVAYASPIEPGEERTREAYCEITGRIMDSIRELRRESEAA